MKSKLLRSVALAVVVGFGAARPAEAAFTWSGCGGTTFATCASVTISVIAGKLVMQVDNWGSTNPVGNVLNAGSASIFTSFGLQNAGVDLSGLDNSGVCTVGNPTADPTCFFTFSNDLNDLSNFSPPTVEGAEASPPPTTNGLNPPSPSGAGNFRRIVLTFSFTGTFSETGASFSLHGQDGPNNCSTKLKVTNTAGVYTASNGPFDPNCVGEPPHEIVPEPMTMSLVALGLVMMGGAGLVRRRRKV